MRGVVAAVWLLVGLLFAAATSVAAQQWDPTSAVSAYAAAFNAHDAAAALALFDENGSATDGAGHHFEGQAGLREFLQATGFGTPGAYLTTQALHVVGNRAVWTYQCSCASTSTEVRVVMNHDKISVFAIMAPLAAPQSGRRAGLLPWLVGLLLAAGVALGAVFRLRRGHAAGLAQPASQGRMLATLRESRVKTNRR